MQVSPPGMLAPLPPFTTGKKLSLTSEEKYLTDAEYVRTVEIVASFEGH